MRLCQLWVEKIVASFPPPVFDRLQYAKTEGESLGDRVTCVTPGRREGGGARSF